MAELSTELFIMGIKRDNELLSNSIKQLKVKCTELENENRFLRDLIVKMCAEKYK